MSEFQGKSAVYLPREDRDIDIRTFLPMYDVVYAPVESLIKDDETIYGISRQDALELVKIGRFVPVISRRLGDYDQKRLREIIDTGYSVTPRVLTAGVTTQLLAANPLWRIAQADEALAKAHLDEIRRGIISEPGVLEQTRAFVSRWVDYQVSGCIDIGTGYINDISMLPLRFGPGAFLADVLSDVHGKRAPDLEVRIIGLQISHSMALNATCVPLLKDAFYPLYDLITLFSGAREAKHGDKVLQQLPVVAQIDLILEQLKIVCPDRMPILEWIDTAGPCMDALRNSLESSFKTGDIKSLERVKESADKLERDLERISKGTEITERVADNFELVGLMSDVVSLLLDITFPGAGTVIGVVLKRTFPRLWHLLGKSKTTQQIKDTLEAANSFVPPHIVRLHRAKRGFQEKQIK